MSQKIIFKYDIPIDNRFELKIPINSHILCVQIQDGKPRLWVLVKPEGYPTEKRTFSVVGTGESADHVKPEKYIGTFQIENRGEIWHLFEIRN